MTFLKTLAGAALLLATTAALPAHADYAFSGGNTAPVTQAHFTGQAGELYGFNYDGGTLQGQGFEDNWGSPGVSAGVTPYLEAQPAYGLIVSFTGGSTIDPSQIAIGNAAGCAGNASGGTTFCTISPNQDIWVASLIDPNTIEFLAQNPSFFVSTSDTYFVNVFFTGTAPTDFTGLWLTEYSPNGIPEPATLALIGAGIAGLGLARRRRS